MSKPGTQQITSELIEKAKQLLRRVDSIDVISPHAIVEIKLNAEPSDYLAIENTLRDLVGDALIDVAVIQAANRRKKLLIADMDSTMIDQECIDELADEVGVKDRVADITARAMNGEIAFEPAIRERVGLLKGLHRNDLYAVIDKRITLAAGSKTLTTTMRDHGARLALVSGGFTVFTGVIAEKLGFHSHHSNTLIFDEEDRLTGEVANPILGKEAKLDQLRQITSDEGISVEDAIAVGDGANDGAMVVEAGLGVAVHGKPALEEIADARIRHGDLTSLLVLQGYPPSSWTG